MMVVGEVGDELLLYIVVGNCEPGSTG